MTHVSCHVTRVTKKWQTMRTPRRFYVALFFDCETTLKADHTGPALATRQVSNLLVVHFVLS